MKSDLFPRDSNRLSGLLLFSECRIYVTGLGFPLSLVLVPLDSINLLFFGGLWGYVIVGMLAGLHFILDVYLTVKLLVLRLGIRWLRIFICILMIVIWTQWSAAVPMTFALSCSPIRYICWFVSCLFMISCFVVTSRDVYSKVVSKSDIIYFFYTWAGRTHLSDSAFVGMGNRK